MAEVWLGHDNRLDRDVAVKLMLRHLAADPEFVARFRREAQAAGRLSHPNIVAVFDTGIDGAHAYIVMELVRGRSVRDAMVGGITLSNAVKIAAQAASGLEDAHRQGLVHRDVKPANILVEQDGRVKVADFGIAKVVQGPGAAAEDMTQVGTILGTAKYLSPEQVDGGTIDARSDVYSLGVVLYEMLCGRPPFVGKTDLATALAHVRSTPTRPREVRPGIPRPLEDIVLKAMSRDPAQRFSTAGEMAKALRGIDVGPDDAVPSTVWSRDAQTPPRGVDGSPGDHRSSGSRSAGARGSRASASPEATRVARQPARDSVREPAATGYTATTVGATSVQEGTTVFAGEAPGGEARDRRAARRPRRLLLSVAALVAGIGLGVTAGVTAADRDKPYPRIPINRMFAFDPGNDGARENNSNLFKLTDNDPATAWSTADPLVDDDGTRIKDGVGVVARLDEPRVLRSLAVRTTSSGWQAEVFVADELGAALAEWGPVVAEISGPRDASGSRERTVKLGGRPGQYVLLWITDFGDGANVAFSELSLRGP